MQRDTLTVFADQVNTSIGNSPAFVAFGLTNPLQPNLIKSTPVNKRFFQAPMYFGNYAFVPTLATTFFGGAWDGQFGDLLAVDLTDFTNPVVRSTLATPQASAVFGGQSIFLGATEADGGLTYVAGSTATGASNNGLGRLRVVDVANPLAMKTIAQLYIPGTVHFSAPLVQGTIAVGIGNDGGFVGQFNANPFTKGNIVVATFDVASRRAPALLSVNTTVFKVGRGGGATRIGPNLFAFAGVVDANNNPVLLVVDANNPAAPVMQGIPIPQPFTSMQAVGNVLYATLGAGGFAAYSIPGIGATPATVCPASMDAVVVVDRGGNYDSEKFAAAKAALRSVVESLQMPADQIAVASFTTSAAMEQTLVSSTQLAFDALERIIPGGNSYIGAGIAGAQAELGSVRRKPSATPVMIVLSDGSDAGAPNPSASITAANATAVNADNPAVTWSLAAGSAGTISTTGLYTAPASVATTQTVTVRATSVEDSTKWAEATILVSPPVVVTINTQPSILYGGQTKQFTASVLNTQNSAVTWSALPSGAGTISTSGLYTAPATVSTQQTVTVRATSVADPLAFAESVITLMPPISITLSGGATTLYAGRSVAFTPTVTNTPNTAVTWTISPQGTGTISAEGVYTAPALIPTQSTVTITATSQADPTKSATASITLLSVTVSVAPLGPVTLYSGQTQQFSASIGNSENTNVTWSVSPAGAGTIAADGLYSAPATITSPQTVTITATSVADSSKTASATVNLAAVAVVEMTPRTVTLSASQTQQFTTTVTGASNTAVTWSLQPAGLGTISTTGLYTAPACVSTQQTVSVIATSVADPSKTVMATVTLTKGLAWSYQRAIRINRAKVPNSTLLSFPVLIKGTFDYLRTAANGGKVQHPNGFDIVFTSDTAATSELDHEIETYNPATGELVAWVRIPSLSNAADTVLYLNYGNAAVTTSQENRTGVWGTSYKGVWHLGATGALSTADSTAAGRNGTNNGATATAGLIGTAAAFGGGTGRYIDIGNMGARPVKGTISFWALTPAWADFPNAFTTAPLDNADGQCGNAGFRFEMTNNGRFSLVWAEPGVGCGSIFVRTTVLTTLIVPQTWNLVTLTWDSAANVQKVYWNGAFVRNVAGPRFHPNFDAVKIGVGWGLARSWNGSIDETRMSDVERSADWIAAEYQNQRSPETFYTIFGENTPVLQIDPQGLGLYGGQTQQFSMSILGGCNAAVNWSVTGAGSISTTGLYSAPASIAAQQNVTITATSAAEPGFMGSANVVLLPPAAVSVNPGAVTLFGGQTQQFSAVVANALNTAVTWSVTGLGSITPEGVYLAPATITAGSTATVRATSVADATRFATATVALSPGQGVSTSGAAVSYALKLAAESLCRRPHAAPVVDAGPDQFIDLSCSGSACTATRMLTGLATNFYLNPGQNLTYGWSVSSGPGPVTFTDPSAASTSARFTTAGVYTIQLSVNDGVATSSDTTTVIVNPATSNNNFLYVTPQASGPNPVGTLVTLRLKWVAFTGAPVYQNTPVVIRVTGANPGVWTVMTDNNSSATISYVGANPGPDTVVAEGDTLPNSTTDAPYYSNTVTVTWVAATPRLSSSAVTGKFLSADGTGVFNTPASQQPVFTQVFSGINFNPATGATGVSDSTRPFTHVVTDGSGAFAGLTQARSGDFEAGVSTLANFSASFAGNLNVPAAGPVTFTFTHADGFVFGVGGGATRSSGPLTGTPTTTAFSGLPVMGGFNQRGSAPATQTIVVNFPAAGAYPYEVDYAKGGDGKLTLVMQAGGAPILSAASLILTPAAPPALKAGMVQSLTLTARDERGVALANLPVTVTVRGINAQTQQLTTDATGSVAFSYAGSPLVTGTDYVQATSSVGASNVVPLVWHSGTNQAPQVSGGPNQAITLPNGVLLSGSASDDGLPSGTLTVSWSKVSGPGTVTFENPNQAVTRATFGLAGTYVLKLTASDSVLISEATVTIAVNADANAGPSWIQTSGTVTGIVPVTLTPGTTLQAGVLSIYPADNPSAAVVLNANTTGTGTIGSVDTTTLSNGSYILELNATNTSGASQISNSLITVEGEYKPGRVTATVTDLIVPAAGIPVKIGRVYDSLERNTAGEFGYGWRLEVNALNLKVDQLQNVTLTVNGMRKTFYFTPQPNPIFQYWMTPQFTAEPGFYGSLITTGDNCSGVIQQTTSGYRCPTSQEPYTPAGYIYTDPYGRQYTTTAYGAVMSLRDLNGNTLTVGQNGISSSAGNLTVAFTRDAVGRITRITDPLGKEYVYGYNAIGELASVTQPAVVGITAVPATYAYNTGHYLREERDARGNLAGSTTYYPDGRLQSVTDAVGNTSSYAYDTALRRTTITHPDTGVEVLEYDAFGSLIKRTDGLNRVTSYTFDTKHNLLTETNALGKVWTYTYDANGFKTSVKDPLNNVNSAVFNATGRPTSVTNPLGKTQSVTYTAVGDVDTMSDALGQIAKFTWNSQGLPLTMIDARGNASSYAYDPYGNRTSYTDPQNRTTTTTYDTMGRKLTETDPRGNVTTWTYNALGFMASTKDADLKTTTYEYDANGNKTAEVDPLGRRTEYTYDAASRLTQVKYADLRTVSFTYDFRGNKLTKTDEAGRVTKYVYDKAGQLTSTTQAFGTADAATVEYTYDLAGRKLTEKDERGNVRTFAYDDAGRLTSITNAQSKVTSYTYDAAGQRKTMADAKLRSTSYDYDDRGRMTKTTYPDAKFVTHTYDGLGLRTSTIDQENRTTTWAYDKASQLVSVTNAMNQVTSYTYDLAGNKISQTDAVNRTTTYEYDKLNRRTKRTLPLTYFETYSYDGAGNLVTRKDFNGRTTAYAYDPRNRLASIAPDAAFASIATTFTYTPTGKRETMTDPSGVTTWTYDARDRVKAKATPQGTLTYAYDGASNVTSVLSSNANGVSIAYAYDSLNRLQMVTDNRVALGITSYAYDDVSQLAAVTYPNGVVHTYAYDANDRVTSMPVTRSGSTLASYTQAYSFSGRKTSVTEAGGRSVAYGYDTAYRLLSETISGASPAGAIGYAHDAVGNRLTRTSTVAGIPAATHAYDANDQLAGDTYDQNGNTLTSGPATYTYDYADRLLTGSGVTNVYDGDGNRVGRTVGGVTTRFLVDDLTPAGYAQVAEEVVGGAVARRYTHGPMRISQSQLVGGVWTTHYYGYDDGSSVRQLFDGSGAVTDTYVYDAFGSVIAQTGSTPNVYLYRGEQFDPALELYYLRARWMQPRTGRFVSADIYEGEEREPASLHAFLYAEGDPIRNFDPSGFNSGEYGTLSSLFTRIAALTPRAVLAGVTLGQVQRGTQIAYWVSCCLARAWSVLDLALSASLPNDDPHFTSPAHLALGLIDDVCKLGPCGAFASRFAQHTDNARPSTKEDHQKGRRRGKKDQFGGEKGDKRGEHWPSKKPANWPNKVPYPPRDNQGKIVPPRNWWGMVASCAYQIGSAVTQ